MENCKVDGCTKPANGAAIKQLCRTHQYRSWKYGDPEAPSLAKKTAPCHRDDCDEPARIGIRCLKHGRRYERHGDENYEGKVPTQKSVVDRLTRGIGRASEFDCTQCGMQALRWVYNHADPQELTGKDGRPYSRYPKYYEALCQGCEDHMAIYRSRIRMKVANYGRKTT